MVIIPTSLPKVLILCISHGALLLYPPPLTLLHFLNACMVPSETNSLAESLGGWHSVAVVQIKKIGSALDRKRARSSATLSPAAPSSFSVDLLHSYSTASQATQLLQMMECFSPAILVVPRTFSSFSKRTYLLISSTAKN